MTLEILNAIALAMGVTTATFATYSLISLARRQSEKGDDRSVSISISGEDRNIHIDATGMSEKEILNLIASFHLEDEEPEGKITEEGTEGA